MGRFTLPSGTGNGLSLGQAPHGYSHLCSLTQNSKGAGFLILPDDTWWVHASGLSPCVHVQVLNQTKDVRILVYSASPPRVIYYPDDKNVYQLETSLRRGKREAIAALLACTLLGVGVSRATGAGTSALIPQDQNYRALRVATDADITTQEKSRTGGNFLFLHQGDHTWP